MKKRNRLTKSCTISTPTWRAKHTALAFVFLIFLNACSDPSAVGIELAPGNNQIGVRYAEFELPAQVVLLDSFETTTNSIRRGILSVGHEQDDFFGITEASAYTRMQFNPSVSRPESEAVLDSVFFDLRIVSVNGSNLDEGKYYSVHRITEPILDTTYFNTDQIPFESSPIAFQELVFGETKDTTVQLSVTPAFQEEMFGKMKRGREFESVFSFREYFPGIVLKARTGDDATIGFLQGENTGFTFYYHLPGDSVSMSYQLRTNASRGFVGVESDRTGTPLQGVQETNQSYEVGDLVGAKANLGMTIKLDTSPIDEFLDTLSGVVFNQIRFEIGETEPYEEGQSPLFSGYLYFTGDNNQFIRRAIDNNPITVQRSGQPQLELDLDGNEIPAVRAPAQLIFDETTDTYGVDLTSYFNAVFRESIVNRDWLFYGGLVASGSEDDDFKKSLRQFVTRQDRIKIKAIYSRSN